MQTITLNQYLTIMRNGHEYPCDQLPTEYHKKYGMTNDKEFSKQLTEGSEYIVFHPTHNSNIVLIRKHDGDVTYITHALWSEIMHKGFIANSEPI